MGSDLMVVEVEAAHRDAIWALWPGTGWNEKYGLDREPFDRSWSGSFLSRCILAEDRSLFYRKLGFRPRPDNKPGMEYMP